MILVDTSVWIDHLRQGDQGLVEALETGQVLVHPFVVGELACGNLANRVEVLNLLQALPPAQVASHEEVLAFIERRRLMGRGIGYVDVHLLASVALDGAATLLWTRDRRLAAVAADLALADESHDKGNPTATRDQFPGPSDPGPHAARAESTPALAARCRATRGPPVG